VDNRLLSDNVLRCLRCSYFGRDSRCSSGFLRRGGFLVACDCYAFNQFPEPRQKWIGSRHGDAVLTFFLISCVVWKGRQLLKMKEGGIGVITTYSPAIQSWEQETSPILNGHLWCQQCSPGKIASQRSSKAYSPTGHSSMNGCERRN
jgi:hypothetical protein